MRVVRVRYHQEPEGWWAESNEVAGWTAVGSTFDEVQELAIEGLAEVLGEEVYVEDEGAPFVMGTGVFEASGTVYAKVEGGLMSAGYSIVPATHDRATKGIREATFIPDERLAQQLLANEARVPA